MQQGNIIYIYHKWFRFFNPKKTSRRLSGTELGIPSSCLFIFKKEGYVVMSHRREKDEQGNFAAMKCKIFIHENIHISIAKDLKLLYVAGWREGAS
jgi:hypothetical protein